MPQETNLNISPYFDDFDANKNFYKVLFKPGYPVQARELTGLQSILQNQIEQFGNHVFKEGSVVIPGQINYNNQFFAVEVEDSYAGISLSFYLDDLVGKTIKGATSNVQAKIVKVLDTSFSERSYVTLYVSYQGAGVDNQAVFSDAETLLLEENLVKGQFIIQSGEGFANTAGVDATSIGSAVILSEGVYFIRGTFVNVESQTLILDAHSNFPSYKVGFDIVEEIISSDDDETLNDNAKGFTNYAASGADRFRIRAILSKKPLDNNENQSFISLLEVREGILISGKKKESTYNILQDEIARRTYDESGDYYVRPFSISARESLNNNLGNNGIFNDNQLTYSNNVPSDSLGVYRISPGKAYVQGYEVETISTTYIDFEKPRTTNTTENEEIVYQTGSTYVLNRVYGAPSINLGAPFTVSLRSERIGGINTVSAGKEIGLARVYDFALESGSYDTIFPDLNQWNISLFDIQTYTEISLNEPITLSTPKFIKGKSSGATGYLVENVTNSNIITLYGTKGTFSKGEKFIFDGLETDSRVSIAITSYAVDDVQSLSQVGTSSTIFNADIIPDIKQFFGNATITTEYDNGSGVGISTIRVTDSQDIIFTNIVKPGNLISYTKSGETSQTFSKVLTVNEKDLVIAGITTVANICEGSLPQSNIDVNDLTLLASRFLPSGDNTLYTTLPRPFISNVDLSESNLIIRKEYPITISSNETNAITADQDETFLPFDEERYVLTTSSGEFEILTEDRFIFANGQKQLQIVGLASATDANARLIATLRKINVKNKVKNKTRINSLVFDRSRDVSSGVGTTSLNDGLSYSESYPYGTRVQDEDLCLLVPDVTKVYAILESTNTNDPILPTINFSTLSGASATTEDLAIGEEFIGERSGAVGVLVSKINDGRIEFSYLNENVIQESETIRFKESGVTGIVGSISAGSRNVITNFTFDYGQKDTIYDYTYLKRNVNSPEPKGKIRVIYESADFTSADTGDIVTSNSYNQYDYCTITFAKETVNNGDIIDGRLRVKQYDLNNTDRSPFEFWGRSFDQTNNCTKHVLASDESFVASYSYYLPRIDKIYLTKDGIFQLNKGTPAEMPEEPPSVDGALEVATISIPPYLCDASRVSIDLTDHKRYRMSDIAKLEERVKNLEKYTSLNLLESATENLKIKDSAGLDRFKSGFFVDDFTTTSSQTKTTIVKNSIDTKNSELRPAPYTTEVDLIIGSRSLVGIGSTLNPLADPQYVTDLIGNGSKRTGQLISLDYEDVVKIENPYATRTENITPFLVISYTGSITLFPSSDTWVDQVRVDAKNVEIDNFTQTQQQLIAQGWDPQTGLSPVSWGAWETTWTGETVTTKVKSRRYYGGRWWWHGRWWNRGYYGWNWHRHPYYNGYWGHYYGWHGWNYNRYYWGYPWYGRWWGRVATTTVTTTTKTGTSTRTGTQQKLTEEVNTVSLGDSVISTEVIPFMRSRNVEFIGTRFKPFTRVYAFFDGQDVNKFIIPKLLEVEMSSGVFEVGETVIGIIQTTSMSTDPTPGVTDVQIQFRLAASNHRSGPFNVPTDIFNVNPYDKDNQTLIQEEYSTTSTILNVDVRSLAEQAQGDYYGYINTGMILRGKTSGAEARITDIKLVTDAVGAIYGSYFIPNPNVPSNPTFETGKKTFKLTSSEVNSQIPGVTQTSGEEIYEASGKLETIQETIQTTRNAKITSETLTESKQVSETTTSVSTSVRGWYGWPYKWRYRYGKWGWCRFDPLAQSFFVEEENGIYVTKVEIFFRTKDAKLPVIVQLRPMQLGLPQTDVYPFSEITVEPKDINLSEDGSVPTVVTFPSPVYLKGGTEHALVLMSESNEYNVWISRLGEIDVSTISLPQSQQIVVTQQPLLGSLFKSQNGSTWDPSQYEDLKFTLFKAKFTSTVGKVNFYNPDLNIGNKQIANLLTDPLEFNSRRIRVGLGSTVQDTDLLFGNTVIQVGSNGTGNYVGKAGVASSDLTIINNGTGYVDGYYSNVSLVNVTGSGKNATANITISGGEIVALGATINSGGTGYRVGDVVTVSSLGGSTLGRNIRLSVSDISGFNEIILDQVQGTFQTGVGNTIRFVAAGIGSTDLNSTLGGGVIIESITPDYENSDGLHILVNHKNHGMHFKSSSVSITGCYSDIDASNLNFEYDRATNDDIILTDMIVSPDTGESAFATFEGLPVDATNPGYIKIDQEIIAYTGIDGNTLTGITRGIDQTQSFTYPVGTNVMKYELNGISLRRINKVHTLQDSTITRSIDIDSYYIKINTSQDGKTDALPLGQVDRSGAGPLPALYPFIKKSGGGTNIFATQNIPFEIVKPIVQIMKPADTSVTAKIRTVTGSSVDGIESPYLDAGYEDINLDSNTYLSSPRIIASKQNELTYLSNMPGNKSFTLEMTMNTSDENISPVIDLDRVGMIFISNRVNKPIQNYAQDFRVSTLSDDPSAFVYATNPITLEVPGSSIKVLLTAHINSSSDLRALYAIMDDASEEPVYYPFPGFSNKIKSGQVINLEDSDGTPDDRVAYAEATGFLSNELIYKDYEFTIDNLPNFKYFSVKLIGSSSNQAYPPRLRDLRIIALA
jgi:hypothetical protein